jgi:probable HAF family extracellular repeat protein
MKPFFQTLAACAIPAALLIGCAGDRPNSSSDTRASDTPADDQNGQANAADHGSAGGVSGTSSSSGGAPAASPTPSPPPPSAPQPVASTPPPPPPPAVAVMTPAEHYSIVDLPTLGGEVMEANAINDAGQVVGLASLTDQSIRHGFFYEKGATHDLGSLGGPISFGYALNSAGDVAGYSTLSNKQYRPFVVRGGVMTDLGTLGGRGATAHAINDSNDVVGESSIPPGPMSTEDVEVSHAFLYSAGVMTDLGTLGGEYSSAYSINNAGQIVGYAYAAGRQFFRAFLTSAGQKMIDLGTLGGSYSRASAINDAGMVVGQAYLTGDASAHAFAYRDGAMIDLDSLGNVYSEAVAVSAGDLVVGDFLVPEGQTGLDARAFIYGAGQMRDLNKLIPPDTDWILEYATGVNASGQIVGTGTRQGRQHAFLLVPQ